MACADVCEYKKLDKLFKEDLYFPKATEGAVAWWDIVKEKLFAKVSYTNRQRLVEPLPIPGLLCTSYRIIESILS